MTDQLKTPPTLEALRARREEIIALAESYGASNVRVFGSVARGEAHHDSDVDFLINFPKHKSVFELVGLWLDMQELLDCDVSLVPDSTEASAFFESAHSDAIAL